MRAFVAFIVLLYSAAVNGQSYQLLPDSCTFCMFLQSTGGNSWNNGHYQLDPVSDTLFMGNTYMRLSFGVYGSTGPEQPFAFRQAGNKLYGIVHDSISEFLIMDFGANVDDTIHDLYSEGIYYDARVTNKDSVLVNGGVYHHYMNLEGIRYRFANNPGGWQQAYWLLTWNERGLCGYNFTQFDPELLGGVLYNIPFNFYVISVSYSAPEYCTTDTLYNIPPNVSCENCIPQTNSINETGFSPEKHLIKIVDVLGRETVPAENRSFIYIYNDGTTKKVFKVGD